MRGSIQKTGKNRWRLVFDLDRGYDGKRRQKVIRFKGTKTAAETKMRMLLSEYENGGFVEPSQLTVGEFLETWLEHITHSVSDATFIRYEAICRNHIVPSLGKAKIQKLHPLDVQKVYSTWMNEGNKRNTLGNFGLSNRTVAYHHRVFRQALRQAVQWKLLTSNPLDAVKPPRVAKTEVNFLDKTETAILLSFLEGKADYPIILLAVTTGMRRGEVLGLRWRDVHLDAKGKNGKPDPHLRVTQNMTCLKGMAIPKEPKTASSRRRISLPSMTVEALHKHRAEHAAVRLQLGIGRGPNDLVFTDHKGAAIIPSTLSRRFSRTIEALDIPHVSIHGLRHSHITQLLMEGVPIKVVSERAGHSSIVMTLDKYGHVVPDMQQNAAEVIDAQLREALAKHADN